MRAVSLLMASSMIVLAASPALAQMKTTNPKTSVPAPELNPAIASGDEAFRPTRFLNTERAQVLGEGNAHLTFGGLSFGYGLGGNMELDGSAGLSLGTNGYSLSPAARFKHVFSSSKAMTIAWGAMAGLALANTGVTLNGGGYVPISFWALGPGDLHLMPYLTVALAPFQAPTLGGRVGYEIPIMANWTVELEDDVAISPSVMNNFSVGARVALTPNLTADVGSVTLSNTNLSINLITLSGTLGGKVPFLRGLWGL